MLHGHWVHSLKVRDAPRKERQGHGCVVPVRRTVGAEAVLGLDTRAPDAPSVWAGTRVSWATVSRKVRENTA